MPNIVFSTIIFLWYSIIKNVEIILSKNDITKRNYLHHYFKWSYRWAVVNPLQNILWSCMGRNSSTVLQRILRCKIAIKQYFIAMKNKGQCSSLRQKNISLFPYPILFKYLYICNLSQDWSIILYIIKIWPGQTGTEKMLTKIFICKYYNIVNYRLL